MMLRPTESKILWLQQFGRGLRRAPGKERLTVIDYIGNHRVFLLKPQTLFGLPSGDREIFNLLERLQNGTQELPPGCEVTYELEAVDILKSLLRRSATQDEALQRYYEDFERCTECAHSGRGLPGRLQPEVRSRALWLVDAVRRVDGRPDSRTAASAGIAQGVHHLARHDRDGQELQDARAAGDDRRRAISRLDLDRRARASGGTIRDPDDLGSWRCRPVSRRQPRARSDCSSRTPSPHGQEARERAACRTSPTRTGRSGRHSQGRRMWLPLFRSSFASWRSGDSLSISIGVERGTATSRL